MRRTKIALSLAAAVAFASGLAAPSGCSATGGSSGPGGSGGTTTTTSTTEDVGGFIEDPDGGADAKEDVVMNPCGTECKPAELCDADHVGLDDDCNGQVDETCDCSAGEAHSCFEGDPSYIGTKGCYPGTMKCTENGVWGPCVGGVHAAGDECFLGSAVDCHPISAVPFQDVNLKDGTGNFGVDAVPGTEKWTVACPAGVDPCPAVGGASPPDDFKPLQLGEYTVTYEKGLAGGGTATCSYPLFVGAPGLRVELEWEHPVTGSVDLDLHLHQPGDTTPWSFTGGTQDCTWANCTIDQFKVPGAGPDWFDGAAPPDPVDWYVDPVLERNTCYFAPHGKGAEWQALAKGCHNPRLDLDNQSCEPLVLDPNSPKFCAPENANVDFPPVGKWFRIGVHYFTNNGVTTDVHPRVKVFCEGALAAELGPAGFYSPKAPVTFVPSDGAGASGHMFWMVADVGFQDGTCGTKQCVVRPLYADKASKTPLTTVDTAAKVGFGPAYPPSP